MSRAREDEHIRHALRRLARPVDPEPDFAARLHQAVRARPGHRSTSRLRSDPLAWLDGRLVAELDRRRKVTPRLLLVASILVAVVAGALVAQRQPGADVVEVAEEPATDRPAPPSSSTASDDVASAPEVTSSWEVLPPAPIASRSAPVVVGGDGVAIVYGGQRPNPDGTTIEFLNDGAVFHASRRTWSQMAPSPLAPRDRAVSAWTGREMLVVGGQVLDAAGEVTGSLDGAAYDPEANSWRRLRPAHLYATSGGLALWTGRELIVAGYPAYSKAQAFFVAYDPDADEWNALSQPPHPLSSAEAIWTGDRVLVWDETLVTDSRQPGPTEHESVFSFLEYVRATDEWRRLALPPGDWTDRDLGLARLAWVGSEAIFLTPSGPAAAYDPQARTWRTLAPGPTLAARGDAIAFGLDDQVLYWGGSSDQEPGASVLVVSTQQWRALARPPVSPPAGATYVGGELVVVGGDGAQVEAASAPVRSG